MPSRQRSPRAAAAPITKSPKRAKRKPAPSSAAKTGTIRPRTTTRVSKSPKRGEARRRAIEAAAETLFLDLGFERTTMMAVARLARASKETVYSHFPTKEVLFRAVIADMASEMWKRLNFPNGDDLESTLRHFARDFLAAVASERVTKLYGLIIGERSQFPELGTIFYGAGPEATQHILAEWLKRKSNAHELEIDDPHEASVVFLSLLFGSQLQRLLVGVDRTVSAQALKAQAETAVRIFIKAYSPTPRKGRRP